MVRPDVPVFPPEAEGHPGLRRLPFPAVADSRRAAESLSDAGRGVVHLACSDMADATLEGRLGRWGHLAVAAEKLAGHEPRPADAALDHPDSAWAVYPARPALAGLAERWGEPRVVAGPCRRDEVLSAA